MLKNNLSTENWFALLDNLNAAALQQSQKKRKAFVRLVPGENRQLMELTFDANDFKSNINTEVRYNTMKCVFSTPYNNNHVMNDS